MIDVAIVDYGMGNLRSVSNAVKHVAPGLNVVVTSQAIGSLAARMCSGWGAMPDCMRELDARARPAVLGPARTKPFAVSASGVAVLFDASEEGNVPGLGCWRSRSAFPS
jgi:glutamine amidotransferase